jgi:hypothetical protein
MTSLALPGRLPRKGPVIVMTLNPRASFTVFDPISDYDLASFVMSILQMISPECDLVVHEWTFNSDGKSAYRQSTPPLSILVFAFCGDVEAVSSAIRITLEKAITTTIDTQRQNPADGNTWKGVTLKSIWGILRTQSELFTMSYIDFVTSTTQQRLQIIMAVLSPNAMSDQGLDRYNYGTKKIPLHPTFMPPSFSDDIANPDKMRRELYGLIPNTRDVHVGWGNILRPFARNSSTKGCMHWNVAMSITDNAQAVRLLDSVYIQIYSIPNDVLSLKKKHELCLDMTKEYCVGTGSGMNPTVFEYMRNKDFVFEQIRESPICMRVLEQWRQAFLTKRTFSTFFVDMVQTVLESTGIVVNVRPISYVIAICATGALTLPCNERYLNINLVGPPGSGKSLVLQAITMFKNVSAQHSETLAAMLCGESLLNIPETAVSDGSWTIRVVNDMADNGDGSQDLAEIRQLMTYDGRADRKVTTVEKGKRTPVNNTIVGRQVVLASTNHSNKNEAMKARQAEIYVGPGSNFSTVPTDAVPFTSHDHWKPLSMLIDTLNSSVHAEYLAANVGFPNIVSASGWVIGIFDAIEAHNSPPQRFYERLQRIASSLIAQNIGMYRAFSIISKKPVMDNDQFKLSLATPMTEDVMSQIACLLSPVIPKTSISDIYFQIICNLAAFVDFEFQTKEDMYPIMGYEHLTAFERSVLQSIKTKHNIKISNSSGKDTIANTLLSNSIISHDTTGGKSVICARISAMTAIISSRERIDAINKFIKEVHENVEMFETVKLNVSVSGEKSAHADYIVFTREFVRWLCMRGSEVFNEFLAEREKDNKCYKFLVKCQKFRDPCMWAELVNIGLLPTKTETKEHKIVDQLLPEKRLGYNVCKGMQTGGCDTGKEFMLPLSVLTETTFNMPNIVKLLKRTPRLGPVTVPATNNNEITLDVVTTLRNYIPRIKKDKPVYLLDKNMHNTVFPNNTDSNMVFAATMATTIAATMYESLNRVTDLMIENNPVCSYLPGTKWELPLIEDDLQCDNISVISMTARAAALLMCAYEQRLVQKNANGEIIGTCHLFVAIAEMLQSVCELRAQHIWKFIQNATIKPFPSEFSDRILGIAKAFFSFIGYDRYIADEEIDAWISKNATIHVHANAADFTGF